MSQQRITVALLPDEIRLIDAMLAKHDLRKGHILRQLLRIALDAGTGSSNVK